MSMSNLIGVIVYFNCNLYENIHIFAHICVYYNKECQRKKKKENRNVEPPPSSVRERMLLEGEGGHPPR